MRAFFLWCVAGSLLIDSWQATTAAETKPKRADRGILVLYDFHSVKDGIVHDHSKHESPIDLRIDHPKNVRVSADGLKVIAPTRLHSEKPATRLMEAIKRSRAITIEAWLRPAKPNQTGPARIVTLSKNSGERNFTLGQDGDKLEVRLRTTENSLNGIPALVSKPKSFQSEWTHVVYTRNRAGQARIVINGKLNAETGVSGDTSNWDGSYELALANELSNDRPWVGTYRLIAIYDRDLTQKEIEQNFRAGRDVDPANGLATASVDSKTAANAKRFEIQVAALISNHCLECHDSLTRQGKLDLSRRVTALAGGENGPVLVPGKSDESRIWEKVFTDEMPRDREPLTAAEKKILKDWLDDGATWSLEVIDPAVYVQGAGSQRVFVQRLTVPEYIESIRSTLGVDIAKEAKELLPRDLRADGFSNTAYNLNVDLAHIEAYSKLAEIVADRIDVKSLTSKHTDSRELTDENVTKVIEPVGRLVLRGPVSKDEVVTYCGISTAVASAGGNFDMAVRYIVQAMLQSPRFLYRIENHQGDGSLAPVSQHELASRLSYIVWGGPPDNKLLTAADKNQLDRAGVASQLQRMLKDRRAIDRSRQFISEWLNLGRLENLKPDPKRFPNWDAQLAADMRHETLAYFEELAWKQQRPLSELLNARFTFVTPRLARHYGLQMDSKSNDDEFIRYDLTSVPGRGGILTHGSILTVGGDEASMVTRGLFVMTELLRGVVRDPPPCVDTTPVPSKPGLTQRAIAETRIANKNCSGCHSKFEPLSFGLEKFDGLGTFHEKDEHGNQLREDGTILLPGQEKGISYKTSSELMDLLAKSDRVRETLTWKLTQFAVGRPLGAEDVGIISRIHDEAWRNGGKYSDLLTAIVVSDLVMSTRTETQP